MTKTEYSHPLEFKFADVSAAGEFSGLASAYSLDSHRDIILPGAFTATLKEHKAAGTSPAFLWSHDQSKVVGRITKAAEDEFGLAVAGKFNLQTASGRDAHSHVKAGDLNGLSIGYRVPPGAFSMGSNGVRTLRRVDLHEISVVALPSNKDARIRQVKMLQSAGDLERLLREGGLSKRAAENVAAHGYAGLTTRAADEELETGNLDRIAAILRKQSLELKGLK
jgi:uncharacterized protein